MKAIMISKPPKIVANVLNGLVSILIFKTCPKDWKDYLSGKTKEMPKSTDVYICCTKGKDRLVYNEFDNYFVIDNEHYAYGDKDINGKVVAKFTLNKVEKFDVRLGHPQIYCKACVGDTELLENHYHNKEYNAYALHISNLEIFDEPKELWQFKTLKEAVRYSKALNQAYKDDAHIRERLYNGLAEDNECANAVQLTELTEFMWGIQKAPQSWCYIEAIHND